MKVFYGLVHKEPASAFGVSFPDLPGCFSAADDEEDLLLNAQAALALYLKDEGEAPVPRSVADLVHDQEVAGELAAGAFMLAVPLIQERGKSRFNLMLDQGLVESVDKIAMISGISRSEYVTQSLQTQLKGEAGVVIIEKADRVARRGATTGKSVASSAAKVLKSKTATRAEKAAAASALTQKGSNERTSARVASSASKVLRSKSASKDAKSAAASALTQKKR